MKVIFNKSDLVSALDRVQRAAQTKVTSNTNNGFFISAAGENILIQANDYTIGIKTSCPANIEEEGVTVIAAPQLQSTIRMMPAGDITMEKGDHENLVSFQSGSYVSKFPTRDQVEFPDVQEMDHRNHCLVKCRDFADMVSLVSFAAANDKQKPIFPVFFLKSQRTPSPWLLPIPIAWQPRKLLWMKRRQQKAVSSFPPVSFPT